MIYDNTLYFEDEHGWASALSSTNGRLIWHRRIGTLAAASPALDIRHKLAFFTLLSTSPGAREPGNGAVVAVSMKTGKVAWSHPLPAGSESSPLVHGLSVFLGDQGGTVYSFRTYDGHLNWTFQASGAVKGGVAFAHNTIYFGDYGAHVYAVNAANGREIWSAAGGGSFYSTPAVAFGRVYIGSTSGAVYAFWASSGATSWTASTGAYVYASPAVADVPGLGPTVYIGSYDGHLYAYSANTGGVRWSHGGGGRIDGSATVVGNVVYYSSLGLQYHDGPQLAHRSASVLVPRRRVHSGDHRRKGRVPDRVRDDLSDASEALTSPGRVDDRAVARFAPIGHERACRRAPRKPWLMRTTDSTVERLVLGGSRVPCSTPPGRSFRPVATPSSRRSGSRNARARAERSSTGAGRAVPSS